MTQQSPLVECAERIYETEKGVSFSPDSTYVNWENPFPDNSEDDVTVVGLSLARPHPEKFKVVRAYFSVGMDNACIDLRNGTLALEASYERFAERFLAAYDKHKHELCIEAAKLIVPPTSIFIVTARKPISGEISRF
ncbi:MAG: hypothetical protein ABIR37_02095 [Candidatus Saccharimonadales bacterium]